MTAYPLCAIHKHPQDLHIDGIDQGQVECSGQSDSPRSLCGQGQWKIPEAIHDPPAFTSEVEGSLVSPYMRCMSHLRFFLIC